MEPVTIGLWVSGGMLVMVLLGMRVAFAAGLGAIREPTAGVFICNT